MHEAEIPTANLTALTANLNRDPKKQRKGFTVKDFCFFAPLENENEPEMAAANAYMYLIEKKLLPSWALCVFGDMRKGEASKAPNPAALIGEGVILLNPTPKNGGVEGLLLANSSAANNAIQVTDGESFYRIAVPDFDESRIAREGVYLPMI